MNEEMPDALFGTDGIRGLVGIFPLLPAEMRYLGRSLGQYIQNHHLPPLLVVGRDTRESGLFLEKNLCQGIREEGVNVQCVGIMSTPGMSFLTCHAGAALGVMISASHNTHPYNGLKIFDANGYKLSRSIERELSQIFYTARHDSVSEKTLTSPGTLSLLPADPYLTFLQTLVGNLQGLSVVVDGAHGACSAFLEEVWTRAGAHVVHALGLSPTGQNINDGVGSLHPEGLREAVLAFGADLGIGVDGDGDRILLVDANGTVVDGDQILACLALILKERDALSGGVVGTIMSNSGLEKFLASHAIPFVRTDVGDRCITEELTSRKWILGGESCGHIVLRNSLPTGDGCAAALWIAEYLAQKKAQGACVGESLFPLFTAWPTEMRNIGMTDRKKVHTWLQQERIQRLLSTHQARLHRHGGGRILLRPSGTEPLLRLLVEGACSKLVAETCQALHTFLSQTLTQDVPRETLLDSEIPALQRLASEF